MELRNSVLNFLMIFVLLGLIQISVPVFVNIYNDIFLQNNTLPHISASGSDYFILNSVYDYVVLLTLEIVGFIIIAVSLDIPMILPSFSLLFASVLFVTFPVFVLSKFKTNGTNY